MKKPILGKGLRSLIPSRNSKFAQWKSITAPNFHPKKDTVFYIETRKIKPNPDQPRKIMHSGELKELAQSIREHGILQPLVVTKVEHETSRGVDVEYELIAGERRLEAAKQIGLREVPAIIKRASGKERLELALVENIQRADLNAVERARAFKRLEEEFGLKHTEIAERVGKSREAVSNTIRLLDLPSEMQRAVEERKISEGHARALLAVGNKTRRNELFQEMLSRPVSVREAEFIVRTEREKTQPDTALAGWKQWEEKFGSFLNKSVRIRARKRGGDLLIPFENEEELTSLHTMFASMREEKQQ